MKFCQWPQLDPHNLEWWLTLDQCFECNIHDSRQTLVNRPLSSRLHLSLELGVHIPSPKCKSDIHFSERVIQLGKKTYQIYFEYEREEREISTINLKSPFQKSNNNFEGKYNSDH